jgi:hypothetical protein
MKFGRQAIEGDLNGRFYSLSSNHSKMADVQISYVNAIRSTFSLAQQWVTTDVHI